MKSYLIFLTIALFLGCSKSTIENYQDIGVAEEEVIFNKDEDRKRYTYSLVEDPNAQLPKKICCGIGNECKKKECAGIAFTQYEWNTYFQGYTYTQLLTADLSDSAHADYVKYLQSIGFGM